MSEADSADGFDYTTTVTNERDPYPVEQRIASELQACPEVDIVGWSATREALVVEGENVLMLTVGTALAEGCEAIVKQYDVRNFTDAKVTVSVEESLDVMAQQ